MYNAGDLMLPPEYGGCGCGIVDRLALWFQAAELDVEEIVLSKCVGKVLGGPIQQFKKLIVGEQVPVAPNHR